MAIQTDDDLVTCEDCGCIYRLSEGHDCVYDRAEEWFNK